MTSNSVPVYRHGRKFYVSTDEYERMRSEERRHRRSTVQKSHQPTSRSPSAILYKPILRSNSTPYEHTYGVLNTAQLPTNIITNNNRREANRLSRSRVKHYDDLSTISKKTSPTNIRSNPADKVLDIRRTPQSHIDYVLDDYEVKRSISAEVVQPPSPPPRPKQMSSRRPIPTTVSDYGMSPISTVSMTPTDQIYTQTNPSKLTNYFARMKQSSLNPPTKSSISGTGSLFETGMQGSDQVYTVLGSSNRRTDGGPSSLLTRSSSDNKEYYYHQDTASGSVSDDNSSTLSALFQRNNTDTNRYRRTEQLAETDDDYGQQRDVWTRSTMRSQSSDGLTEKKRVRFADMEGLTLETTTPDKNRSRSPMPNRLLTKRQHAQISNDSQKQPQPFYNALYQATTRIGGNSRSKLATDV
jgi:hypothetical protein